MENSNNNSVNLLGNSTKGKNKSSQGHHSHVHESMNPVTPTPLPCSLLLLCCGAIPPVCISMNLFTCSPINFKPPALCSPSFVCVLKDTTQHHMAILIKVMVGTWHFSMCKSRLEVRSVRIGTICGDWLIWESLL